MAYNPDPAVSHAKLVSGAAVRLEVSDTRKAESPNWIADKKNGYGMRMASIVAQRPVADLVRDALAHELTSEGIQVGDGPETIAVEVSRLESVYQNRFFTIGAIGYADLAVQVRSPNGQIAYARTFSVSNDEQASLVGTPSMARLSFEKALSKVVGEIISDPAFMKAVLATPAFPTAQLPMPAVIARR